MRIDHAAPSLLTKPRNFRIRRIKAVNSIEFAEEMLRIGHNDLPVAPFRSGAEFGRLGALPAEGTIIPAERVGWATLQFVPLHSESVAQIVMTSGTTGTPKAIALTHENIADTTARLIDVMEMTDAIREYVGVPITYSFGLGRIRSISAVGGSFFLPVNGFSLAEFFSMLEKREINSLSAVPTILRLVLQNESACGNAGRNLRWLEIGSQSMTRAEKEAIRRLFPNAIIVQHYGLTEASRSTFLKIHETSGEELESVGRPTGSSEIAIDAGVIRIRGRHVARHALHAAEKQCLLDADGWLTTGDAGEVRNGLLYFKGRTDDLINCGGVKLNPEQLEFATARILDAQHGDLAVARIPDALRGEAIMIAVKQNAGISPEKARGAVTEAAAAFGVQIAGAVTAVVVSDFPRTETGKIRRSEFVRYLENAFSGAASHIDSPAPGNPAMPSGGIGRNNACKGEELQSSIVEIWKEALGLKEIDLDQSFYDVGGDSLSAVAVVLNLERAGLDPEIAQGIFAGKTIRELACPKQKEEVSVSEPLEHVQKKPAIADLNEASNFVKGLALLCMISSHWLPPFIQKTGAAREVLMAAGAPFFSFGTPTLAFIFGVGIAVFQARQFEINRSSFEKNWRLAIMLLGFGVLLNGALETLGGFFSRKSGASLLALENFYGPFLYFFLMSSLLPIWIRFVRPSGARIAVLFLAGCSAYVSFGWASAFVKSGLLDSAFLEQIVAGRWSFLLLGSVTLLGCAAGLLFRVFAEKEQPVERLSMLGAFLVLSALSYSVAAGQVSVWFDFPKPISLMTLVFYAGVAIALLGAFRNLSGFASSYAPLKLSVEVICSAGILLFPLFVLQSLVYGSAAIWFHLTGDNFLIALFVLICAYGVIAAHAIRKVKTLYYGKSGL